MRRLCEKDHLHPLGGASEDPLRPFELTKRAVDELGRQLEALCDKEFATISQTGTCVCGHVEIPSTFSERNTNIALWPLFTICSIQPTAESGGSQEERQRRMTCSKEVKPAPHSPTVRT